MSAGVLHPFLFALFPIISLLASNIEEIHVQDAYRSSILALFTAAFGMILLTIFLKNWHRAAIMTSLGVVLLASYGHVYSWLKPMAIGELPIGRHRYLVPAIGLLLILALWVSSRLRNGPAITTTLNLVAIAAVAIPIFTIGVHNVRSWLLRTELSTIAEESGSQLDISGDCVPRIFTTLCLMPMPVPTF